MSPQRARLVFVAVLLAVFIPVVIVLALAGGDESEAPRGLRLEGSEGDLVVYLSDAKLNRPATAGGRRSVMLECTDAGGTTVVSSPELWPFADTDDGQAEPHVHVRTPRAREVTRCSLLGTDPLIAGDRDL